jgi:hypothetical protein
MELLSHGKAAVQVGFGPAGNARVAVMRSDGTSAAVLGAATDGTGAVAAYDAAGAPVASLLGGGPSGPLIGVGDVTNRHFLAALLRGKNGGKLELADNHGGVKADAGTLPSGAGVFRVRGEVFQYISGDKLRLPGW